MIWCDWRVRCGDVEREGRVAVDVRAEGGGRRAGGGGRLDLESGGDIGGPDVRGSGLPVALGTSKEL